MISDSKMNKLPMMQDEDYSYNISKDLRPSKRETDNGSLFSQMLEKEKKADGG